MRVYTELCLTTGVLCSGNSRANSGFQNNRSIAIGTARHARWVLADDHRLDLWATSLLDSSPRWQFHQLTPKPFDTAP